MTVEVHLDRAWLEISKRRYSELVEGKVKAVPGPLVFAKLRDRLAGLKNRQSSNLA